MDEIKKIDDLLKACEKLSTRICRPVTGLVSIAVGDKVFRLKIEKEKKVKEFKLVQLGFGEIIFYPASLQKIYNIIKVVKETEEV